MHTVGHQLRPRLRGGQRENRKVRGIVLERIRSLAPILRWDSNATANRTKRIPPHTREFPSYWRPPPTEHHAGEPLPCTRICHYDAQSRQSVLTRSPTVSAFLMGRQRKPVH